MKILAPIKRVPDPYGNPRLGADGTPDTADMKWVINPFDEIALEEAVRQKESGACTEIVAVTVGGSECVEQLRAALAMGADSAILIDDALPRDPAGTATLLAAITRIEQPAIVLMGKQAVDDDYGQTGPMLAALLSWPQVTFASQLVVEGNSITVTREVDSGRETVRAPLPAVVTVDLRLNEPRYVALPAIIRARNKPIQEVSAAELGGRPAARLRTLSYAMPPARKPGRKVASVDELITALRDEAGVI